METYKQFPESLNSSQNTKKPASAGFSKYLKLLPLRLQTPYDPQLLPPPVLKLSEH